VSSQDESRNVELRSKRDAYATKTPADDAQARDFQHAGNTVVDLWRNDPNPTRRKVSA
jgi:hypothetical protein